MPTLAHAARPIAPPRPPPRPYGGQRRPFVPAPSVGPYRLPAPILDRLQRDLAGFRNRDAAMALAVFLARFWSAPRRVALAFPADRRALAQHAALDLSEDRVRGAIATLERVGFIVREIAPPGRRYQRTADGLQRRPILFRFGLEAMGDFLAANTRRKAARQRPAAARDGRLPIRPPSTAPQVPRPSLAFPATAPKPSQRSPIDTSYRLSMPLGEKVRPAPAWTPRPFPTPPASDLAAALERIRAARTRSLAAVCKFQGGSR